MIAGFWNIPKTECFVPHSLTPEQREDRDPSCQVIIAVADTDNILNNIISGDQTWCFTYDPEKSDRVRNRVVRHPVSRKITIPKVPHQDYIDIFSTLKAQCTKNSYQREKQ
jgi:hypothetical protein